MPVIVKHSKTNAISDWTQAQLNEQIALGNFPAGTTLANIVLPSDWNNDHTLTGVGTMAEQNANSVSITGGSITGVGVTVRVVNVTSSSSITIDSSITDQYSVTALAVGTTFNAPTGSPTAGQKLIIRIKDNGTGQTLAWNAIFRVIGVTLPTTTVANKTFYIACIYNLTDTSWDVVSVAQQV